MDSLPWTPFSAIKAQKQISAAKQIVPVIHQTNGIKGYKSVQSVTTFLIISCVYIYIYLVN